MSLAVPLYGFGGSGGSPNKSIIIVAAPTGSTVTCKMGSTTKTASLYCSTADCADLRRNL